MGRNVNSEPIEFYIWCKIDKDMSVNSVIGKHWSKTTKIKDLVTDDVIWQVKTHGMFKAPVEIKLSYNSRLDLDNHAFIRKYIIDAMRKGRLIAEDNPEHVVRIVEDFWDGNGIRVAVKERET